MQAPTPPPPPISRGTLTPRTSAGRHGFRKAPEWGGVQKWLHTLAEGLGHRKTLRAVTGDHRIVSRAEPITVACGARVDRAMWISGRPHCVKRGKAVNDCPRPRLQTADTHME